MKFSIPDNFPVVYSDDHAALDALRAHGDLALYSTRHESQDELIERLRGAAGAINVRAYSKFTDEVFAALPELKFLTVMGTGTDNIDLAAATQRGVVVSNTPTAPTISVSEFAIALTLAITKNLVPMHNALRGGEWRHLPGIELRGKTFGFVGLGIITHEMVSLHLRASPKTQQIVGRRELELMKPSAYLVNTGRGALVDEGALFEHLKAGKIAGAAIDVYQSEPLPASSPLLTLENVLVTPHVAWVTDNGIDRMARHPVENILAFLEGKPQFVVNPDVLARR
jgi:phosphoglycerate dehydrogenase-like enzyme